MSIVKIETQNDVTVSPQYAAYLVDLCRLTEAESDLVMRPVRKSWVTFLAEQMRLGRFEPTSIIATAHLGDRTYLVNGNHTLRAIIQSGVTLRLPHVQYTCSDFGEVRNLYAKFDRNRPRTRADALRSYDAKSMLGLKTDYDVNRLGAACNVIYSRFSHDSGRIADEDLLPLMEDYATAFLKLGDMWSGSKRWSRIITKKDCLSVALVTTKHAGTIAEDFWGGVIEGVSGMHDPRIRCRDYLVGLGVRGKATPYADQSVHIRRKIAYCWNAFVARRDVVRLYLPAGDMELAHTPFVLPDLNAD